MVSDPSSLSRRQLLGGLAGAVGVAAGGTVAVGAEEPTVLPDTLTDEATKLYPTPPETSTLWRPTVTEAHAREAVSLLADTVSRGRRLRQKIDTDRHFYGAGGWLEDARDDLQNGNYPDALFDATYGIQFAGEDLGFARAKLGRANLETLAERGEKLLGRAQRVADDVRPYPTVDPGRDLAWYYRIESELVSARLEAGWDGMENASDGVDDGNGPRSSEYDADSVGGITARLLRAEIHVRNAERYHDLLSAEIDDSGTQYADHLRHVAETFETDFEALPTRNELFSKYAVEDSGDYGPYEFAHLRLVRWCVDVLETIDETDGLLAYRAVERSKALAKRRAYDFAVNHLVVEPDDEGFDSGYALAEKRRARSTYRSVVGSNPSPLLTVQIPRAVENLRGAKVGSGGGDDWSRWEERLSAYLYALTGRAELREYPAVYDAIVDES